jgi:putative endonuclease
MKDYFVYILKCSAESYYTGVTNNLEKRVSEHKSGRFSDVNQAIRFEKQVKGWNRRKKEALINKDFDLLVQISNLKKRNNRHPSTGSG